MKVYVAIIHYIEDCEDQLLGIFSSFDLAQEAVAAYQARYQQQHELSGVAYSLRVRGPYILDRSSC